MLCHQLTGLIEAGTDEQPTSSGATPDSTSHATA
jgi:hypothetical protein